MEITFTRLLSAAESAEGPHDEALGPDELDFPEVDPAAAACDPEPLMPAAEEARPYPIQALSPTVRAAVSTYQQFGQQPVALVATSALSVAALATQGLADVARDRNCIGPISLSTAVLAEFGERKTSADNRMSRAARRWQQGYCDAHVAEAAKSQAALDAWDAQRQGVLRQITVRSVKGSALEVNCLRQMLEKLDCNKPHRVVLPGLFYQDATPEALAEELALGWPSAALWSNEAALVVGSRGMSSDELALRYFGLLNICWDGTGTFERNRTTAKSYRLVGRRLTCSLMMQQAVLRQLLSVGTGQARSVGFLARFLIAWPQSTMGTRLYREGDLDHADLRCWDDRVTALLNLPLPADPITMVLSPPVIQLSGEARACWI